MKENVKRLIALAVLLALLIPAARAEVYVLNTNGSAVLADAAGSLLIRPGAYAQITPLGDSGLYAARRLSGGGLGVIRADGSAVTGFDFSALECDGDVLVFAREGKCGVMSLTGETLIEPLYTRLISAGESGFLAFRSNPLDDTPDSLWLVAPDGGEHMTGLKLSFGPLAMSEGLAEAADTLGRWGYVDGTGGWAIEPAYAWCGPFRCGLACAADDGGMGLIDRTGAWVVEPVYRRIQREPEAGRPLLAFGEDEVSLLDPQSGRLIARFAGDGADAAFTGGLIRVRVGGRLFLADDAGNLVSEAPEDAVDLAEQGGCVIIQRSFSQERPFSFLGADGTPHGDWQELSFAGWCEDRAYFIFSEYDAVRTDYADQDLTFYDETAGTRRYGILNDAGEVVADDFISLRPTANALLAAETEIWIGLIRPDGTALMKLEKEE